MCLCPVSTSRVYLVHGAAAALFILHAWSLIESRTIHTRRSHLHYCSCSLAQELHFCPPLSTPTALRTSCVKRASSSLPPKRAETATPTKARLALLLCWVVLSRITCAPRETASACVVTLVRYTSGFIRCRVPTPVTHRRAPLRRRL